MTRMKIHMVDQEEILRLKGLGHSKKEVSKPFKPSWVDDIDGATFKENWKRRPQEKFFIKSNLNLNP